MPRQPTDMRERNIAKRKTDLKREFDRKAILRTKAVEKERRKILKQLRSLKIKQLRAIKAAADQYFQKTA